jgi:hypothetical protein
MTFYYIYQPFGETHDGSSPEVLILPIRLIKRLSPRLYDWINTKLSEPTRRRAEITVFFCGMFVATFLAWRDQYNISRDLEAHSRPPEDLIASFMMDNLLNTTNDLNEIKLVLNNNGAKSAVIDSISLIINYFSDDKNDAAMRNDICDDPAISQSASLFLSGINVVPHTVINLDKERNVSIYYYKADRYLVDGLQADPPIAIDAGKSRGITTYFKVDRSNSNGKTAVVWCPVIRFLDNGGRVYFSVCKGSIVVINKTGYGSGPYALSRVRLLPPPPNNTMMYYECRPV